MSLPPLAHRTTLLLNSGFKRIWELSRQLKNPINLGVGEPHFEVPEPLKDAAIAAIRQGKNTYTNAAGIPDLRAAIKIRLDQQTGRSKDAFIACGTNGALTLALNAIVNPGDEIIVLDPYFVAYPQLINLVEGRTVFVDTYPDFQPDPDRIAAAITPRTRGIILCTPGNPTGIVAHRDRVKALAELADRRGILLISDEIYATFVYDDAGDAPGGARRVSRARRGSPDPAAPGDDNALGAGLLTPPPPFTSPAAFGDNVLVCSSFSKTHAMTGWRLGYAYGPPSIINAMIAVQQAMYVCAPHMAQVAGLAAWDYPMTDFVHAYQKKRDQVLTHLDPRYEVVQPAGAFYVFPKTPWGTATEFTEAALNENLVLMPGSIFSQQNTHFRLSYAVEAAVLDQGLAILNRLATRER